MAQYYLIEEKDLRSLPWAESAERLGFLDFLRAMQNDPPALIRDGFLRVEGLEDVLLAARPNMRDMAIKIRHLLQGHASMLNGLNINIAMVFRNRIIRGDQLIVEHPTEKLPISFIFGSPCEQDVSGSLVYAVSFNLSSAV